jgi:hypothetical protein
MLKADLLQGIRSIRSQYPPTVFPIAEARMSHLTPDGN